MPTWCLRPGVIPDSRLKGPALALADPYFDLNHTRNPLLSRFNHVYVRYCDGGYYRWVL